MIHAFISDGRLYVRDEQGRIDEIESIFVKEKLERAERHNTYYSWKCKTNDVDMYFNSSSIWGRQAGAGVPGAYRFKDVVVSDKNTIYYLLSNNVITGLFRYDLSDAFETRLFHRNDLIDWGFDFSSARQDFIISVQYEDMRCNLELFNTNGSPVSSLTAGDSRDSNPSFSFYNHNHILFQSSGISRDEDGHSLLFGPEAIYCLDLDA